MKKLTMNRFLLVFLISMCHLMAHGQNRAYGYVVDSFTGEAVDSCEIMLYDADTVKVVGRTPNHPGGWHIDNLSSGDYVLKISAKNYYPEYHKVKLSFIKYRKPTHIVGTFKLRKLPMSLREHQLGEVVVKSSKVKMYYRGDTIVYNADAFQLAQGSMLDGLVSRLPGVELKNGQIFVNGEFVDNLMINGRDFFKGNPKIALDNLPGYMVNTIKVYRKESDRNVALGIQSVNKKDKELVMDVNLKKIYSFGWSMNVEGGLGTDNHYAGKLFGLRFSNYSRSVLFGNVNNTNNASVPGTSGNWNTQYDLVSPTRYYSTGLMHSIDDRQKRFKYEGNVTFDYNHQDNQTFTSASQFLAGGDTYSRFRSQSTSRSSHLNTTHKLTLQKPNSNLYMEIQPKLDYTDNRGNGSSRYVDMNGNPSEAYMGASLDSIFNSENTFYQKNLVTSNQQIEQRSNGHTLHANLSAIATLRFFTTDVLNIRLNGGLTNGKSHSDEVNIVRHFRSDAPTAETYKRMYAESPTDIYNYQLGADYSLTYKFKKSALIVVPKYDFSNSSEEAPRTMYTAGDELAELFQMRDIVNSYDSKMQTTHHQPSFFVNWQYTLPKQYGLQITTNLNQDFQKRRLTYKRNTIDTVMVRNDATFSPRVSFRLNDGKRGADYTLNYSVSRQLPSLTSMLPYTDDANPLVVMNGNPDLKTATTHQIEFFWSKHNWAKRRMLDFSAYYITTKNAIANSVLYDRTTGITTMSQCNTDGNYQFYAGFRYSGIKLFPKVPVTLGGNTGVNETKSHELINVLQSSKRNSISQRLSLDYSKDNLELSLFGRASYQHITTSAEGSENINSVDFSYGLNGVTSLPWKMTLSGDMTMYCRRGYSDHSMNTDQLVFNLQIGRSFFNDKVQFRLVGYDLLGQIDSVTQTINQYGRKETWRNVITRYVMVHLSYRFNKQPKKKA